MTAYLNHLEFYSDEELHAELTRRRTLRDQHICDFCKQPATANPCYKPERHALATPAAPPKQVSLEEMMQSQRLNEYVISVNDVGRKLFNVVVTSDNVGFTLARVPTPESHRYSHRWEMRAPEIQNVTLEPHREPADRITPEKNGS